VMMSEGAILALDVDDAPGVLPDLEAWAEASGHRIVENVDLGGMRRLFIARGPDRPLARSMAVVVSDPGLEELLSPLGFALAGALEAMAVHVYFQGPAVRVLDKRFMPHLRGWRRPFSRFARNGLEKAGHVHPHEKLGHIRSLGGTIYACAPSMAQFKVPDDRLFVDDIKIVEYLTFARVLESSDVQIYP
ncbi:MAG TPA: DsrE family protein, partial [Acidimicrobiia bacterium]|nr:DsrE family protein [Acidimicrobiia bacterium]